MNELKSHRTFEGKTQFWEHNSQVTGTPMKFSSFTPDSKPNGLLIWLSGLSCTEENFITKAGAQRLLSEMNLALVCPDTSPRGTNLPHEHDHYDFGSSAGFFVDATTEGYRDHYRMYSYIIKEFYPMVTEHFGVDSQVSLFGHSMGGHGALVLGLREPEMFNSISAFAPIVHPSVVPWGQKAFKGYLGTNTEEWKKYDAVELIKSGHRHSRPILIDQGTNDPFLEKELKPELLIETANAFNVDCKVRMQEGYDHSYYFISTFIDDHILFHANKLGC